ncbi:signal peptidase I [Sphingomonas sp. 67-41]|uniref:signal peptidase I n=1 Tax=Sphingomonas TaxID=13687 RepID=UPI00095BAC8E|nr:signal peptidase I [Sphingomonas sp. 67-41]OJY51474.1 MAG: signal peptidase I [Sphingomonas sp. 67-41]
MTDTAAAQPSTRSTWRVELRYFALLALLALLVFSLHSCVGKPFYIPSESMMPGLMAGDRLILSKYPYGWSYISPSFHILPFMHGRLFGRLPARGDVVVLTPPGDDRRGEDLIKRVIGLPGDTVQMVGGRLWLNGKPVQVRDEGLKPIAIDGNFRCAGRVSAGECRLHMIRETLPGGASYETIDLGRSRLDDTAPYVVPADHVFVMGDNRDNSSDSRLPLDEGGLGGAIPVENISGRAEFITFSLSGDAGWNPLTWHSAFRMERTGTTLRPDKPR